MLPEPEIIDGDTSGLARSVWTIAPRFCEMRSEVLDGVGPKTARVRTLFSGISGGTESLVYSGKIPASEFQRMRAPFQAGDFPFPVKYGYASVGVVEAGPDDWTGACVFVLHPHQDRYVVPVTSLTRVEPACPPERAVLSANLETALNAVWDGAIAPGERVAIIGAGVIGSLLAAILSRIAGVDVTMLDTDPARAARADHFGANFVSVTTDFQASTIEDFDCVFQASGHPAGLATALSIAETEARIIDVSWYGSASVTLPLGEAFHSRRLQIISSQVGSIAPARRSRFDYRRRMAVVQKLLLDDRLDTLIGARVAFDDLPRKFGNLLSQRSGQCPLVIYP